jgi:hypothetical protein
MKMGLKDKYYSEREKSQEQLKLPTWKTLVDIFIDGEEEAQECSC